MSKDLASALWNRAAEFGLTLTNQWSCCCERHFLLVKKWERGVSLSRYGSIDEYARWGYLEGLFSANSIKANTVVDVGAGAGFPGVAMASAKPGVRFVWLEPQAKRWAFLKEVVRELKLHNVTVVRSRFEDFEAPPEAIYFVRALDRLGEQIERLLLLAKEKQGLAALAGERVKETLFAHSRWFEITTIPVPTSENRYLFLLLHREGEGNSTNVHTPTTENQC